MQNDSSNGRTPPQGENPEMSGSPSGSPDLFEQKLQELYPDLYRKIKPHMDAIARELQGQMISDSVLDAILEEIMNSSAMPPQDDDLGPAVPAIRSYGGYPRHYGYPIPYYRRGIYPGYYYDNSSLDTLLGLMLLRRLGGRYYY